MVVSTIGQSSVPAQSAATTSATTGATAQASASTSGTKEDSAVISQKAKDMAAAQAGKSFQEEATESASAKLQEANGH